MSAGQHGTLRNNETGQELTGTERRRTFGATFFDFQIDGTTTDNSLAQDDWTFTPDAPPAPPEYPYLSVAMGGYQVPAVKTHAGWLYVNENGAIGEDRQLEDDEQIDRQVKQQAEPDLSVADMPRRVYHEGKDITHDGA